MKDIINKFVLPLLLILLGLFLVIFSLASLQNNLFLIGSFAILLAGVITLLNTLEVITNKLQIIVLVFLILSAAGLAMLDYRSIKNDLDFLAEKERRYDVVIQRLKDIRRAQLAYKGAKGVYAAEFDSLIHFIKRDSLLLIIKEGFRPDTLTEVKAVELGIIKRDTTYINVQDSIFSLHYLGERRHPFILDSLPYVPFSNRVKFQMKAGQVEKNGVMVQVFEVTDSKPFDIYDVMKVGSMTDPSTSGNWE